jgi:hypothetical protein
LRPTWRLLPQNRDKDINYDHTQNTHVLKLYLVLCIAI